MFEFVLTRVETKIGKPAKKEVVGIELRVQIEKMRDNRVAPEEELRELYLKKI